MQIRSIHPFPARMAPDLALVPLAALRKGSKVLDPMSGSGTVIRQAIALGHKAIGFDLDPLAVLMSRVWTTPVVHSEVLRELQLVLDEAVDVDLRLCRLTWISEDAETKDFIRYWFAPEQRRALGRLAYVLAAREKQKLGPKRRAAVNVLRLGLSRIIVTKDVGASLARDASHSRPHKVAEESDYDVFAGFAKSVHQLLLRLGDIGECSALVQVGDARRIDVKTGSVDAVVTSPPYLNAIDYMRGHRLSLVWLGYSIAQLRAIRSSSIGAERGGEGSAAISSVVTAMHSGDGLSGRHAGMIRRYAQDLVDMTYQVHRVLRRGGSATFVVGNSCLKGKFILNSAGLHEAAMAAGLREIDIRERDLPANSRYLPISGDSPLSKRMRTETILTFDKPA